MQVTRLYLHPVKSLGGVAVTQFTIDRFGPHPDRRWLVVDKEGRFLTQRQHAAMALVRTSLDGESITLSAPDCDPVSFSSADFEGGEPLQVRVWRDGCDAVTGPRQLDDWLSAYLGVPCRLVYMPETSRRNVDPNYANEGETVSFADGFPLLLTSEQSLADLNARLTFSIGMERFRPNLVVDGSTPFAEDEWKRIRVGSVDFIVAKPCSRCVIPTIDPATGRKQPEVFKTLKAFRQRGGEVFFGQNLLPVGAGSLQVGDVVEILE